MSTVFPKWTNRLPNLALGGVLTGLAVAIGLVWYYFTPKFWRVGYMPTQPGNGFSHLIHAGRLGMDCRYCHSHIEEAAEANVPSVSTCMGCHADGHLSPTVVSAEKVQFIRDAWESDQSIPWRRVHKVPDYVRNFPHDVHLNAGVSCYSCHGDIMEQKIVHEVKPLSMGWCLECHRNPTPHLVPKDKVTDLWWVRSQIEDPATGESNGNPPTTGQPGNPFEPGSPGGEQLLKQLQDREKGMHLLPQNCGACHY